MDVSIRQGFRLGKDYNQEEKLIRIRKDRETWHVKLLLAQEGVV